MSLDNIELVVVCADRLRLFVRLDVEKLKNKTLRFISILGNFHDYLG